MRNQDLLYSKGGSVCFSYINPAPGEAIDFAAVLGKEFVQKELNLVANLVISAAGQTRPVITEAVVAPDLDAVIGKLLTRHSQEELSALQNLQPANLDKRKYCQIISDLYSEVLALPAPNRGRALRYFLQG